MKSPYFNAKTQALISKAVEQVGDRVFHDFVKIVTDGLPDNPSALKLWETDITARQISKRDADLAAQLALRIEEEMNNAILLMFMDAEFRALLKKNFRTVHARGMARDKKNQRTLPFAAALMAAPKKSTKEILKDMEARDEIEDIGDAYLLVKPGSDRAQWPRIAKTSLDSKISRLRKA
jgi:hypothetical protein